MKYEELYKNFIDDVPIAKEFCDNKKKEEGLDDTDGMHVVFYLVVYPFIEKVMQNGEEVAIKQVFDFVEKIETSGNTLACEVMEQSIMEYLLAEHRDLVNKYHYLYGEETKKALYDVNRYVA